MSGASAGSEVAAVAVRPQPRTPIVLADAAGLARVEALVAHEVVYVRAANLASAPLGVTIRLEGPAGAREGQAQLAPGSASDPFEVAPGQRVTLALVGRGARLRILTVTAWCSELADGAAVLLAHSVSSST